ncbi:type II secretion system F family protein [Actinoalloteichus hymeniacidonis]|uniref:Flp pilus assembly protein TadB n=1 Tax=Actinoalloteichus hymeniacidonis TaxID=340345 RepID=A0AAC9HKQ5_9PSEU|nr:type II secretion system F family protein [Actinoalloteichus hymeniacidonis]AOS61132.1 Flp pilus assembly protein TadB [Actinoalloteichus hymeniacidonis]MBB5910867.1 tight adherence protein B [Actinoalloteichus hymeniacidonis]
MVSLFLFSWGAALLMWPSSPARWRLRSIWPVAAPRSSLRRLPGPSLLVAASLGAGTGWLLASLAGALTGAVVAMTCWSRVLARRRWRRGVDEIQSWADALGMMSAQLRAGASPSSAATSTARDAEPSVATVLNSVASTSRLGGDVPARLRSAAAEQPASAKAIARLSRGWTAAEQHGMPLAEVLDALRRDLEFRAKFAKGLHARMAGPRATGLVLSVLPLLGIALGAGVGAAPLQTLLDGGLGGVLLLVGIGLDCLGLWWIGRITEAGGSAPW